MFVDDYVMRQIREISELAASIAARGMGLDHHEIDGEIEEAYRSLLGIDRPMADRLDPRSLARLLAAPEQITALALLMRAHGDLCASREQHAEAAGRWQRALALLEGADAPTLRQELEARLRSVD